MAPPALSSVAIRPGWSRPPRIRRRCAPGGCAGVGTHPRPHCRRLTAASPLDPFAAAAEAKRTETLLRDARAALRKVDALAGEAAALDDPAAVPAGEARATLERLVRDLERREQTQKQRARQAARRSR